MMNEKQKDTWKSHIMAAILLMAFAFFINRGIEIKGLYMDDLYMWSCFGEQSFGEFVFPIGGTRCRFIFYLASYLEMALIGTHINWMVPINIILNGLVALTLYGMAVKFSRSRFVGFLTGILYLLSRLSYYQISQGWGLMETMALWLAVGILYYLYRFLNEEQGGDRSFWIANGLYFAICFVHERYMVLVPLFVIVLLLKKSRKLSRWLISAGVFLLVQVIRLIAIGGLLPAGTGGTQVADTFSMKQTLKFALAQVAYLFGINAGPEHLSGIAWADAPLWLHMMVYGSILVLTVLILCFLVTVFRHKEKRMPALRNSLLFICFIGGCIASSSVTIRLEMRWVYVSYAGALLYLAYMYGVLINHAEELPRMKKPVVYGGLLLLYTLLMFPVETCYRSYYPKLYYWPNQLRYNSLAEETYEKYGDALFAKTVYILGNTYEMSEFTADTFFKVYDKSRDFTGPRVEFIDSIDDIGLITDRMLVLRENPEFNQFQDITSFVKDLKCNRIYGYYEDDWMDEEAEVEVITGTSGVINLELTYPGNLTGQEVSTVYADGVEVLAVNFEENIMHAQVKARPHTRVRLKFVNNFYLEGAEEQRGEKRFSMLAGLKAD